MTNEHTDEPQHVNAIDHGAFGDGITDDTDTTEPGPSPEPGPFDHFPKEERAAAEYRAMIDARAEKRAEQAKERERFLALPDDRRAAEIHARVKSISPDESQTH